MKKFNLISALVLALASVMVISCRSQRVSDKGSESVVVSLPTSDPNSKITGMQNFIPRAQIYRTNGNYIDNVPIQVSADGKTIISFPAPSDLGAGAKPLSLAEGYLLDRRGVSPNTRFTTYTYAQYAALPSPPSVEELLKSIIPQAMIIDLIALPITTSEAVADTAAVNALIRSGLPGCKIIMQAPVLE